EDGIRDFHVTGVQTCALPIFLNGKKAVDSLAEGSVDNWFFGWGEDGLAGSIQDADKATSAFAKTLGIFGLNMRERGANEVKAFDSALAQLVSEGRLAEAAEGAKMFAREAERGGVDAEKAADMLVSYNDALAKTRLEAPGAAEGVRELSEAAQKSIEAATKAAEGWIDYGAALKESDGSLKGWLDSLNKQAKALENFNTNSVKALGRGLRADVIDTLREMGPTGAKIMSELANASEKEIERANATFGRLAGAVNTTTEQVRTLQQTIEGIPLERRVVINVNTGQALKLIQDVRTARSEEHTSE